MSQRGICSRREADKFIEEGQVYVDGQRINELGTKVDPDVIIQLHKAAQQELSDKKTFIINKPVGYVSAQAEKDYLPAIRLINEESRDTHFKSQIPFSQRDLDGLAPAGRLDIDSKGLLILTQNGQVAKTLIGPENTIEKEYLVKVTGEISNNVIEQLKHGLSLDDKKLKPAGIQKINDYTLKFLLKEGRKRQIRRMCELVDLKVTSLQRLRIGKLSLGELKEGQWRYLEDGEEF